jgi:hypothetical protein
MFCCFGFIVDPVLHPSIRAQRTFCSQQAEAAATRHALLLLLLV